MIQRVLFGPSNRRRHISIDSDVLVTKGVVTAENADSSSLFIASWIALLGDSPLSDRCGCKPAAVYHDFLQDIMARPLKDTILKYSGLFDKLTRNAFLSGGDESITGPFHEEFKDTPIFKEYLEFHRTGNPLVLKYVLTFLRFGKKLEYVDEDFHQTAFRGWLEVEKELSDPIAIGDATLSDIADIVAYLLPPLVTAAPIPRFGPGAVSEDGVRGTVAKAHNLRYSERLDRAFFGPWFKALEGWPLREHVIPDMALWSTSFRSISYSTLRFVPKDITKSRSICMEPNVFMYFQQVVHDWLRHSIRTGPLRHHVVLEDQGRNQAAAVHGSLYGSIDTIDLSAASDRVRYDLVKRIFPREYLYYLIATRTSTVRLPDGTMMEVKKFAPMGSAVCFPVQCIIFSSIVLYSMLCHERGIQAGEALPSYFTTAEYLDWFLKKRCYREYTADTPYGNRFEPFLVYGDDIICDHRVTDSVVHVLTSLGFSVNVNKSFTGCMAFRESCGIYAFNGSDVTPHMYRVKHFSGEINPGTFASLVESANNAGDHGYASVRSVAIHALLSLPLAGQRRRKRGSSRWNEVLFTANRDAFGIFSKDPRNRHLRRRYNPDYQRDELACVEPGRSRKSRAQRDADLILRMKEGRTVEDLYPLELYLYNQDMRARLSGLVRSESFGQIRYRPEETGLARRWVPSE